MVIICFAFKVSSIGLTKFAFIVILTDTWNNVIQLCMPGQRQKSKTATKEIKTATPPTNLSLKA